MKKLPEVEYAKTLMTEAQEWSLWRWLFEKRKVRQAADDANAALAAAEANVKEGWNDDLKRAYAEVEARESGKRRKAHGHVDPELLELAAKIKESLDEAERVRLKAEDVFDEADRRLSADMAREGTSVAIEAWILRERAIRKAESAGRKKD